MKWFEIVLKNTTKVEIDIVSECVFLYMYVNEDNNIIYRFNTISDFFENEKEHNYCLLELGKVIGKIQ